MNATWAFPFIFNTGMLQVVGAAMGGIIGPVVVFAGITPIAKF